MRGPCPFKQVHIFPCQITVRGLDPERIGQRGAVGEGDKALAAVEAPVLHHGIDLLLLSMKPNVLKECQQVTGQQLISLEMVSSGTVLRENPRDTSVVFSGASLNELPVTAR